MHKFAKKKNEFEFALGTPFWYPETCDTTISIRSLNCCMKVTVAVFDVVWSVSDVPV